MATRVAPFSTKDLLLCCPTDHVNADLADHRNNSSGFDKPTEGYKMIVTPRSVAALSSAPKDAGADTASDSHGGHSDL
jgi:hypothetical protein